MRIKIILPLLVVLGLSPAISALGAETALDSADAYPQKRNDRSAAEYVLALPSVAYW